MSKLSMASFSRTLFIWARGAICSAISAMIALSPTSYATEAVAHSSRSRQAQTQPDDPIRTAQLALKDRPKPAVFIERMSAFLRADEVSFLKARAEEIKDQAMPELRSLGSGRYMIRDASRSVSFRVVDASKGEFEINAKRVELGRSLPMEVRWQKLMAAMPQASASHRLAPWERWLDLQSPRADAILPAVAWVAYAIIGGAIGAGVAAEHTCKEIHEYRGTLESLTRKVRQQVTQFPRSRGNNRSRCPLSKDLLEQEVAGESVAALQSEIIRETRNLDALLRSIFGQAITEGTINAGHCADRLRETQTALRRLLEVSREICLDPSNPESQSPVDPNAPVPTPASRPRNNAR